MKLLTYWVFYLGFYYIVCHKKTRTISKKMSDSDSPSSKRLKSSPENSPQGSPPSTPPSTPQSTPPGAIDSAIDGAKVGGGSSLQYYSDHDENSDDTGETTSLTPFDYESWLDGILAITPQNQLELGFQSFLVEHKEQLSTICSHFDSEGHELYSKLFSAFTSNDFYKLSMWPGQLVIEQILNANGQIALVKFQQNIRNIKLPDGTEISIKDLIKSHPELEGEIVKGLEKSARREFNPMELRELVEKKLTQSKITTGPAVSELPLDDKDILGLCVGSDGSARQLANPNILCGPYVVGTVDPSIHNPFDLPVQSVYWTESGEFIIECTGLSKHVTFWETEAMQVIYEVIMRFLMKSNGKSFGDWMHEVMFHCFKTCAFNNEQNSPENLQRLGRTTPLLSSLFLNRRTECQLFGLIINYMVKKLDKTSRGTSSITAWYLLKKWGVLTGVDELNPVGTSAHQFQQEWAALVEHFFPGLDSSNKLVLSQIVAHYVYYRYCTRRNGINLPIVSLPDTISTLAFLLTAFIIRTDDGASFLEKFIVNFRQDSGTIPGFSQFMDKFGYKGPLMASEIGSPKDYLDALSYKTPDGNFPYTMIGAGGYYENPKNSGYHSISMACKIVSVQYFNSTTGELINTVNTIKISDSEGKISIDKTLGEEASSALIVESMGIKTNSREIVFDPHSPALITLDYLRVHYPVDEINRKFREVMVKFGIPF